MAKGFSTQSAMVLLEQPVSLDALMAALEPLGRLQRDERAEPGWMSKPSVLVPMRPEVNGHVLVDLVDESWPDGMGDPKDQVDLFGAWSMGFFGPWVFPGNLSRAQAMSFTWREAKAVSSRHSAFVRTPTVRCCGRPQAWRMSSPGTSSATWCRCRCGPTCACSS